MKAYAIVIKDNPTSERGYENMVESYMQFDQEFPIKDLTLLHLRQ